MSVGQGVARRWSLVCGLAMIFTAILLAVGWQLSLASQARKLRNTEASIRYALTAQSLRYELVEDLGELKQLLLQDANARKVPTKFGIVGLDQVRWRESLPPPHDLSQPIDENEISNARSHGSVLLEVAADADDIRLAIERIDAALKSEAATITPTELTSENYQSDFQAAKHRLIELSSNSWIVWLCAGLLALGGVVTIVLGRRRMPSSLPNQSPVD